MTRPDLAAAILGGLAAMACVAGVPMPPPELLDAAYGTADAQAADRQPRRWRRTAISTTSAATATGASRLATAGPA